MTVPRTPTKAKRAHTAKRSGFSAPVKIFIEALISNTNVTRAYMRAYPNAKTASASASGSRLLGNVRVREAVEQGRREALARMKIDGDQVLQRIGLIGQADVRTIYDENGRILPIQDWPPEAALAVKAIKQSQYGTEVTFDSRLAALELVAAAAGKLKAQVAVTGSLADLIVAHAKPEDLK